MASWGDFIKEIPIVNKRSEGIFVKADHVLDLWEERNKLRRDLAILQGGGSVGGGASEADLQAAADAEREVCVSQIEEMAEALAGEPEPNEQMVTMLYAVARLLREKGAADADDDDDDVEDEAAMAEPMDAEEADAPMAESMDDDPPMAEPMEDAPMAEPMTAEAETPMAEPVAEESAPALTLAELLNRQRQSS